LHPVIIRLIEFEKVCPQAFEFGERRLVFFNLNHPHRGKTIKEVNRE
jgi:hypothetical protein